MRDMGSGRRCCCCSRNYPHHVNIYSETLVLFILIISLFSFIIPYNPSIITKDVENQNVSDQKARIFASVIAIISCCLCWVFVSELVIVFRSVALPYDDDKLEEEEEKRDGNEFYTLSFDGCDCPQLKKGGAGCIIRDKKGDLVVAEAYNLNHLYPDCHVAIAEATALRNGLRLAMINNIRLNLIEGDSQEVIEIVKEVGNRTRRKPRQETGVLGLIIKEIREALQDPRIHPDVTVRGEHLVVQENIEVAWIPREENKVADKLANIGSKLKCQQELRCLYKGYTSFEDLPDQIGTLIKEDQMTWARPSGYVNF